MQEPRGRQADRRGAVGGTLAEKQIETLFLLGALAGWLRVSWRRTLVLLSAGLVFVEAVNLGVIMVTAYTAPARLRAVHSLTALAIQFRSPNR